MAASENPIIVEPAESSHVSPAGSLIAASSPTNSLNFNSDSSRPLSVYSSNTSHSETPSPVDPKDTGSPNHLAAPTGLGDASLPPTPPSFEHLPASALYSRNRRSSGDENGIPRSVPEAERNNDRTRTSTPTAGENGRSWFSTVRTKLGGSRWLEKSIGLLSLITALWLGVRTYKLAVWSSWNDHVMTCLQFKQVGIDPPSACKDTLSGKIPTPPYSYLWGNKEMANASAAAVSSLSKRGAKLVMSPGYYPTGAMQLPGITARPNNVWSTIILPALIVIVALVVGIFWVGSTSRKTVEDSEVFTSPARSHWQLTRHHSEGPKTISGQGKVIKQGPEDEDYPHSLRRHLRGSQDSGNSGFTNDSADKPSYTTSVDTLVAPYTDSKRPSKASIFDKSANEKHENLMELNFNGKTKAFFKPETGEFIHLNPWKSTHNSDDESDEEKRMRAKADEKGSTHKAIGKMLAGGLSFGTGRKVEEKIGEALEKTKYHEGFRHRFHPPQTSGDALSGEVTKDWS